ncbi:peptide-methionine (R)-S-oxide reductase [Patescibacteria group bacterium]|nr:MAG: peptide-methionine (R)-S-oxide reductase [Patescibacteria group bacterium]
MAQKKILKTAKEWQKELTPEQYRVLRQCGTEPAFTGKYWKTKDKGVYLCAACGNELFNSETKYDSGTGWPSFSAPLDNKKIESKIDRSDGMDRVEVKCARCGSHLGHVFDDGPKPGGKRFCINSASLYLRKKQAD